ncbi:BRCA1-A complex subunit RAP80 isoform X3 [Tachysurus fulvidraco]|uniref:BRCA1-A complex subunit RAP80 isoform X3 n=1 Tax=Tachysurus fulvidraco TaxID=1234273 RepID=UPI001FF05350|nr:BRCA1-A complex subunit RAP80 isoform X3 [Tachysurus fulvidraco]
MPRRKRSTVRSERRRKVCRRDNNNDQEEEEEEEDNTLVISDSDSDEEEEDSAKKVSLRAARRLEREKKEHVQDMTEEEMLDLALRLSKQEANCATQREQVEDDDMRKAMAESLQSVGCSQASETSFKRVRSAPKPHQDRDAVSAHVRCKLSFSSKDKKAGVSIDDVPNAQASALKSSEEDGALLPMPDLSQGTLSRPSPPSPTLPSVPSADSQESCSSRLAKQEFDAHRPEDASSQSDAPLEGSPVFLRHCSVRLNQNVLSSSRSFRISSHTTNSALGSTSPNPKSQSSPLPPKSPVFPKTDLKRCTQLTRGKFSDSHSSRSDGVRKPEDAFQESSSRKCRDSPKRLSRGKKAPSSSRASAPEDDSQEAGKVKEQAKEESSRGTGLRTVSDRAPTLDTSSPADGCPTDGLISHMVLLLSDDDDDDDDDDKIIHPSPVFPQGRASCAGKPKLSPTQLCPSSPSAITTPDSNHTKSSSQVQSEQPNVSRKSSDSRLSSAAEGKDIGVVSYFWGIPFCPKGQSPDDYTRVILTQLEVYEKSLKEAQRRLLHKADWGLPVFPCPVERPHGRRLKRHRAPRLLDEDEEEEQEEDEEKEEVQGRDEEEKEKKKKVERKKREDSQSCSEEGAQNGQHETYVVVSSPETQEELGKSPLMLGQKESTNPAKPSSCRKLIPQDLSEDTQIQSEPDELGEEVQDGSFDMEGAVCPETQMTPELMVTSPAQSNADGMEVDEVTESPPEADLGERMEQERPGEEPSWMESVPSQVECPMCTRLFPLSKIEVHAAYCNGAVEEQVQEQQDNLSQASARRKITRRTTEDDVTFEKSEQREKCFLCKKFFTTKEYRHHVDQCIQQKALGPKQGNGLLSALNRTETVHLDDSRAGPSNTTARNSRSLADTSVTPGDSSDSQASGYYVSSSPIKSFTPISEITDCLINFRQQYSDRTSQRLGRKRKFKR